VRNLTLSEALKLHRRVIGQSGGALGVLNLGALESASHDVWERRAVPIYCGQGAALGYSLIQHHPFLDGNKRTGHAAMEVFLLLNGSEIQSPVDEQERIVLQVASGEMDREAFTLWLRDHVVPQS
jgi:death on curing protein